MTVINKVKDPVTRKELVMATGIVEFVKLDKFPELKVTYIKKAGQPDKKVESTHRASLLIKDLESDDQQWIGMGDVKLHPQHENLQVKDDNDAWVTIEKGVEVSMVTKVNEYNGKTYYQSTKGKINVLSTDKVVKSESKPTSTGPAGQSQQTSFKKRDTTGMETGHAVNGALELKRSGVKGEVVDLAKLVHEATVELKTEVAKGRGVDMSDYDTGASVGHAILNACRDAGKTATKESLIEDAKVVLAVSEEVSAFIKSGGTVKEGKKADPEKKVTKPKEDKKEEKQEESPMDDDSEFDFDSEIPF